MPANSNFHLHISYRGWVDSLLKKSLSVQGGFSELIEEALNDRAFYKVERIEDIVSESTQYEQLHRAVTKNMAATLKYLKIAHLLFQRTADTILSAENKYHGFG